MKDCVLCKAPQIDFYGINDDQIKVIRDIHPKSKLHLLIVPRAHHTTWQDSKLLEKLMAKLLPRLEGSYQLLMNEGKAYRELAHVHIHLLSNYELNRSIDNRGNHSLYDTYDR
jgi:histidine triad (HIT) family protein